MSGNGNSFSSRGEAWSRNEDIVSTLRKNKCEITVDVGMRQQCDLFLRRNISANEDACPFYSGTHRIDNMTAYLSSFRILRK